MGRISQLNSSTPNIPTPPNVEFHEARENNEPNWPTRMHRVAVKIASTFFGQAMMMQFDKLLWTLEKTATWISNAKTDGKRAKPPASLVRPLPWVFFLPTLVVLRYTRVILSLLSICFGYDEIEASTMVTFLHQSRRNIRNIAQEGQRKRSKQLTKKKRQHSSMEYAKWIVLSFLSNLSNLVYPAPDTIKLHSNKTSLNATVAGETANNEQKSGEASENSDDSDSEDQVYQDFLSRTFEASDTSDDDFIAELIGDESSDTDSQSSVASEDLSDGENIEKPRSPNVMLNSEKSTNGNAAENDGNYSASSSVAVDQIEIANADVHNDVQSPAANDDALNRLIADTTKTPIEEAGSTAPTSSTRPIKNINRHNRNGRFQTKSKTQNNGKHINGSQGKRNHHVQSSANEFSTGLAAADHHA